MSDSINTLQNAGFAVKPGALLPFITLPHPGQMFRWDGALEEESSQLTNAVETLKDAGFAVEFADISNRVILAS